MNFFFSRLLSSSRKVKLTVLTFFVILFRFHAMKYQAIVTPDGILQYVIGPHIGSRHDSRSADLGKIYHLMRRLPSYSNGMRPSLYADSAYKRSQHVLKPFPSYGKTYVKTCVNQRMSRFRICIEWTFGK